VKLKKVDVELELSKAGVTLLGHTPEDEYVFYKNGKVYVKDINKFGPKNIQLFLGVPMNIAKQIQAQLPLLASQTEVDVDTTINKGIFKLRPEKGSKNRTEFILVNKAEPFKLIYDDGYKIKPLELPIINGQLVDASNGHQWINVEKFEKELSQAKISALEEQFMLLTEALDNLKLQDNNAKNYLAAFIMLAPFHTLMDWRPYIWITGNRGSGKTMLFESVIQKLYDGLTERLDNSTDYGAIQMLNGSGAIPLFDNFEPSIKSQHLIRNFEIASRGGNYVRGTPNSKARVFKLNHMMWFGSVVSLPETSATDSRIVEFRLEGHPFGPVSVPQGVYSERVIANVATFWDNIVRLKNIHVSENRDNGRTAENVAYAHALLQLIGVLDNDDYSIPDFLERKANNVNEGLDILDTILNFPTLPDSALDTSEASKRSVYELLTENGRSIIRKGIWIVNHQGEPYIAINTKALKITILKNTEYNSLKSLYIEKVLLNITGAKKVVVSGLAEKKQRAVVIPIQYMYGDDQELEEDQ